MQKNWQTGCIIGLLTSFYFGGMSQNIDSLESLFNTTEENVRVEIGHQLIEHLLTSDRLKAREYHELTFDVAIESPHYRTRAKAYFYANYFIRNEEKIDYEKVCPIYKPLNQLLRKKNKVNLMKRT